QAFTNIGGYRLEWQLCNTAWVLPQNRERVYLVGYSTKTKRDWKGVFPIRLSPTTSSGVSKGYAQISNFSPREFGFKDTSPALLSRDYKDPKIVKAADFRNDEGLRVRQNGDTPCLSARRHSEKDISTMPPLVVSGALRTYPRQSSVETNRIKRLETRSDSLSNALTSAPLDSVVVTENVRRLTPIECERLQGFPDNWTSEGDYDGDIKPVSNTQRYKMCGNAVTVDIVAKVVEKIKPLL
ncbi:MAG TPA: hypothetical protein DCM10_09325, partial [Xanthomarina gelatinilytica]|nr:hypothetical protein [Xanthomarina gelatinilytica]